MAVDDDSNSPNGPVGQVPLDDSSSAKKGKAREVKKVCLRSLSLSIITNIWLRLLRSVRR